MKLFSVCFHIQEYQDLIQGSVDCIIKTLLDNSISFRQIPLNTIHFTAYSFRDTLSNKSKNEMCKVKKLIYDQFNQLTDPILKFETFEIIKKNILVAKFSCTEQVDKFVDRIKLINSTISVAPITKTNKTYYPHISLGKIEWKHKQTDLNILNNIAFPDITITRLNFNTN